MIEEYKTLRDEILRRLEIRTRVIDLTVLGSGAVWAAAFQSTSLAPALFVYPLLVLFLTLGWTSHGVLIQQIGDYIRDQIENREPQLNWETFSSEQRQASVRWLYSASVSSSGLFLVTQVVSICLAVYLNDGLNGWEWALLGLGILATLGTCVTLVDFLRLRLNRDVDQRLRNK